jgi:diaminopimelate epimerase
MTTFYKYQGAGNDFLIADNRDGGLHLTVEQIASLCDRRYGVGADGLMLLEKSPVYDFRMVYYNSDGSGGMMCGNGGRCMVAFAADMGISHFDFEAADGFHTAQILDAAHGIKTVRLKMKDVDAVQTYDSLTGVKVPSSGSFLDTGTRHYVRFVADLDYYDIVSEGRDIRYHAQELLPVGVNVNFVEPLDGNLKVRTYEKGVEDETYACGTGIVASCVAAFVAGHAPSMTMADGRVRYDVRAKKDDLSVDFMPSEVRVAEDVWLTGPAAFVAKIIVDLN